MHVIPWGVCNPWLKAYRPNAAGKLKRIRQARCKVSRAKLQGGPTPHVRSSTERAVRTYVAILVVARLPQAEYEVVVARVSATQFAAAAVVVSIVWIAEGLEFHVEVVGPMCLPRQRLQRERREDHGLTGVFRRPVLPRGVAEGALQGSFAATSLECALPYQ